MWPPDRDVDDDLDATPLDLVTAIRRTNHRVTARLDNDLIEMGVSFAQLDVMLRLEAQPNLHAGELGRDLAITRQGVHRLLAQLDRAGLIRLLPTDHGVRAAHLTEDGRRRLAHCRRAVRESLGLLDEIPPETRNAALEALVACERALVPRPGWYLD